MSDATCIMNAPLPRMALPAMSAPLGATVKLLRAGEHTGRTGTVVTALPEKGRQRVRLHADKPVS